RREFGTSGDHLGYTVESVGGGAAYPNYNDNGLATQAYMGDIDDITQGPDGAILVAQDGFTTSGRVRRIGTDGIITTLAANVSPVAIAAGSDGSVYFADFNHNQVWKIDTVVPPTLSLVAGNGTADPNCTTAPNQCGDGGDARSA